MMSHYNKKERRALIIFSSIFISTAAIIGGVAYASYHNFELKFREQAESQLAIVADLKAGEIASWRDKRWEDANFIYKNDAFSSLTRRYLNNPQDAEASHYLGDWLGAYHKAKKYDGVYLLNAQGKVALSFPANASPLSAFVMQKIPATARAKAITFIDFYRDERDQRVYLAMIVPILDGTAADAVVGFVALRIDPQDYLYPYIKQWPIARLSSETMLVRREGDDVLFLNEVYLKKNSEFNLRIPLTKTEIPAVKAVLGQTGIVEGLDYRGAAVISDIRAVPDSPWFLITKMDVAEVYAPLRERQWETVVFFGALLAAVGMGLVVVWRHQRLRFYRAQVQSEESLRISEDRYRRLVEGAPDIVYVHSSQRGGAYYSSRVEQVLGYSPDHLYKHPFLWKESIHPDDQSKIAEALLDFETGNLFDVEYRVRNAQGRWIWLRDRSVGRRLDADGDILIEGLASDVTERRQLEDVAQARLRLNAYSLALDVSDFMQKALDEAEILTESNVGFFHFVEEDQKRISLQAWSTHTLEYMCKAEGKGMHYPVEAAGIWAETIRDQKTHIYNDYPSAPNRKGMPEGHAEVTRFITVPLVKEGRVAAVMGVGNKLAPYDEKDLAALTQMIGDTWDMILRKMAENSLKKAEANYRAIFEKAPIGIFQYTPDGHFRNINPAMAKIFGYASPQEMMAKITNIGHRVYVNPPDEQEFQRVLAERGGFFEFISKNYRKNATLIWTETLIRAEKDPLGNVVYYEGFITDISARKRADSARENEDKE